MVDHQIRQIIEAKPIDLLQISVRPDFSLNLRRYANVTARYLEGDLERLLEEIKLLESEPVVEVTLTQDLLILAKLRYSMRSKNLLRKELLQLQNQKMLGALEGEKYFLLGLSFENINDDKEAMKMFELSYQHFQKNDCPKKSLRALYNRVAAESRIFPYKNFVFDYESIVQYSEALNELQFAGMALVMLSREHQILGNFIKAFEMAQKGIEALNEEKGCLHYYHALLHQAHVLIDLKKSEEAKKLIQETELSYLPEIKSARLLLLKSLGEAVDFNETLLASLMPTWKERIPELLTQKVQPTYMEERLLKIIWQNPTEKWDLISTLYKDTTDSEALENRFKNLVARVRKKYPGALICKGGFYYLNSNEIQNLNTEL